MVNWCFEIPSLIIPRGVHSFIRLHYLLEKVFTDVRPKDHNWVGLCCYAGLDYRTRGSRSPVLYEQRDIQIDSPDAQGGYIITTKHQFIVLEDAVLERTPPKGHSDTGKWSGGYQKGVLP